MADNVIVRVPEQQFIRGEDGYSPEVTIENIDHGHSVTITDRDHPDGQNFNVLDGDSAYEQAVAGGYTGTEAQFNEELASFKELSDEAKDAAPFYAEYGETTKAEIAAAINGKRQVYVRRGELGTHYAPLVGTYLHTPLFGSDLETGYRFVITEGTTQRIYELGNVWATRENDLAAPAQRAETAAAQALTRMNSADASAQAAAATATTFTEQTVPAAVNTINEAKADALTAVGNAQTTAVGAVQQESTTQQAAIQQKGEDVLDSIPSDYTELTEDVNDLKSAITDNELSIFASPFSYSRIVTSSMWTNGQGVAQNTGANFNDAKYCRSSYVGYTLPTVLYINSADYEFNCWAYSSASASATTFSPKKEYDSNPVIISTKENSTYFRIGVRRKDGANMSTSDITALTTAVKTFTLTDTTLSLAGVPADAKAVGDKALLFKGTLANETDLNTVVDSGVYWLPSSNSYQNAPVAQGFLLVLRNASVVEQVFVRFRGTGGAQIDKFNIYKRDGSNTGVSSAWVNTIRVFDRKIAFFGDSIMWGRDGNSASGERSAFQIPTIVALTLGVNVVNYGVGTQGYMPHGNVVSAYDNISAKDLSTYDTVVLCYGVNDGYNDLGTWDSTDENTIMGQFNKIINYIYTAYPTMRVIVFAPFNGTNVGSYPDYWYGPRNHPDGYPSRKTLSDTLKQACDYYWIPYIEQYDSPINAKTITQFLPDGVHPNDEAYKLIGEWFAAKIGGLIS